jgi:hypothetical protein
MQKRAVGKNQPLFSALFGPGENIFKKIKVFSKKVLTSRLDVLYLNQAPGNAREARSK